MRALSVQRGATMVEILITLVVISFGLLGLAGLQAKLQVSEMESYQRGQALLLVNDMANRIAANRSNASAYVTGTSSPEGFGATCSTTTSTTAQRDLGEWCLALQGAAESLSSAGSTTSVGALTGGRGCVTFANNEYMVAVVWQGLMPVSAPPDSVACGANSYDAAGSSGCAGDRCRRWVTTLVRIATL